MMKELEDLYKAIEKGETSGIIKRMILNSFISENTRRLVDRDPDAARWVRDRNALQTYRKLNNEKRVSPLHSAMYANKRIHKDYFEGFDIKIMLLKKRLKKL